MLLPSYFAVTIRLYVPSLSRFSDYVFSSDKSESKVKTSGSIGELSEFKTANSKFGHEIAPSTSDVTAVVTNYVFLLG